MRLKVSDVVVKYYSKTSRPLAAENMVWEKMLENFQVEIISILGQEKGNHDASLPMISNKLSITNFFEAYNNVDGEYIGKNNYPINWVLRGDVVLGLAITLAPNQPYSTTNGLVEEEVIRRFTHNHPFYKADSATVYAQLIIATLVSQYISTIDPFKMAKNGCGSINEFKAQFSRAVN